MDLSYGTDQFRVDIFFAQESSSAGFECRTHEEHAVVTGHHQNFGIGRDLLDQRSGQQSVEFGQIQVEQHYVRLLLFRFSNGFMAAGCVSHHSQIALGAEKRADVAPHQFLIVNHQNTDASHGARLFNLRPGANAGQRPFTWSWIDEVFILQLTGPTKGVGQAMNNSNSDASKASAGC